MRNTIVIFSALLLIGCNLKNQSQNNISNENIVDKNQNYEYHNRTINFIKFEEDLQNKTIYFVDNKIEEFKSFSKIINEGNVKNVKMLNDSSNIVKMGFSYERVKKIIIATKK